VRPDFDLDFEDSVIEKNSTRRYVQMRPPEPSSHTEGKRRHLCTTRHRKQGSGTNASFVQNAPPPPRYDGAKWNVGVTRLPNPAAPMLLLSEAANLAAATVKTAVANLAAATVKTAAANLAAATPSTRLREA